MAKGKVIGIIVAIGLAIGLAGGGYYLNSKIVNKKVQKNMIVENKEFSQITKKDASVAIKTDTVKENTDIKVEKTESSDAIKDTASIIKADAQISTDSKDQIVDKTQDQKDINTDKIAQAKVLADAKITSDKKAEEAAKVKAEADLKIQQAEAAKIKAQADAKAKAVAQAKADSIEKQKADAKAAADKIAAQKEAEAIKKEQAIESGKVQVNLPVNNKIVPNGNIIYSAEKYAVPANEVRQMTLGKYKGKQKEIFLTFDDGPSATNTPKVLAMLKKYGVHATFFVVGSNLKSSTDRNLIKDEIMDGNAIGNHSYSHNYKILYPHNSVNPSVFMHEINETNDIMRTVLGKNFNSRVVRMPGGYMSRVYYHDKHLPALNKAFEEAGVTSVDWTAETGDATSHNYSPSQLVQNAIKETKGWTHIVLLMHDIKSKTPECLPELIQYYKSHGYEFKVISNTGIN